MLKKFRKVIKSTAFALAAGMLFLLIPVALLLNSAAPAQALEPVQPGSWQSSRTAHFRFYFQTGDEVILSRLLGLAETVHDWVTEVAGWDPGVVDVVLISYVDLTNGLTTPLPGTRIRLYVQPPGAGSSLIAYRDWLEMLFLHEYTHAVHLDMAHGPTLWLRYLFGRTSYNAIGVDFGSRSGFDNPQYIPLVPFMATVPNGLLQPWITEGLATAIESWGTGRGRLYSAWGRMVVRTALRSQKYPNWSAMADNDFLPWPWGSAWYLYGAGFLDWMEKKQGLDLVWKWQHHNAWGFFPYLPWLSYATATGHSLDADWTAAAHSKRDLWRQRQPPSNPEISSQIIEQGGYLRSPVAGHGGFWWLSDDGEHPARVRFWNGTDSPQTMFSARGVEALAVNDHWLVLDPLYYKDEYRLYRHLVLRNLDTGEETALPGTDRMSDPALGADGTLLAIRLDPDGASLRRGHLEPNGALSWDPSPLLHSKGEHLLSPRISPDGRSVAFIRHSFDRGHDLWLVDLAYNRSRLLFSSPHDELFPVWIDNDTLRISSSRDGYFDLYELNVQTGSVHRLTRTMEGWFASTAADHGVFLANRYTDFGFALVALPETMTTLPMGENATVPTARMRWSGPLSEPVESTPYRPGLSLLPRYWAPLATLNLQQGTLIRGLGFTTGSEDILGHHVWSAALFTNIDRWRPAGQFAYAYHGLPVHLSFSAMHDVQDISYFSEDGKLPYHTAVALPELVQSASFSSYVQRPGLRNRYSLGTGVSVQRILPEEGYILPGAPPYGVQVGPYLTAGWSNTTGSQDVPGPHQGVLVSARADLLQTDVLYGEKGLVLGGIVSLYGGQHLFWRNLLSLTLKGGAASGTAMRSRFFTLLTPSGSGPGDGLFRIVQRNRPAGVAGSHLASAELELWQPLWFIQRGGHWFPIVMKRLDLRLFANTMAVADSWTDLTAQSYAGVETSLLAIFAQFLPINISVGTAVSLQTPHDFSLFLRPVLSF